MAEHTIDINCDLGEIKYNDAPYLIKLLNFISSCNIATGFHAGDPYTILKTIREASQRHIAIGVHPSYPDKKGFGRVSMDLSEDELYASLAYQTSALSGLCSLAGAQLHHLKLHGALYHDAHHQKKVAQVVITFLEDWSSPLQLYGQEGSLLEEMAMQSDIKWVSEGFLDRRYDTDGKLVSRNHKDALIKRPDAAISQAINIIKNQKVKTLNGEEINVIAQTLCIHGDHSNAVPLARQLYETLTSLGITITPALV